MWESFKHVVFGRLSIRTFLAVVLVAITAVFANILTPQDALALNAKWQGGDLVIDTKVYQPVPDIGRNDSRGEPEGTHVYQYLDTSTSPVTAENILFAPGSTPNQSNSARLAIYDYTPPNTYKARGDAQSLSIGDAMTSSQPAVGKCTITVIGWIVCPLTEKLAEGMDWMFGVIGKFMAVEPILSNKQQATYKAWEYMRNIANILLVIVFLVIIYSNITSMGISQYGIQKSLPKLVLAALLVNVSFYLCAIAVDISNVLGASINQFFLNIGTSVINQSNTAFDGGMWKSIAEAVLAGGAIAAVGGAAIAGTISFAGAWALLIPVLVGAALAIVTAVVVLAARQALIMALIMFAPLAFIAYILPNTNKYFDKWKDAFLTLLIMFPAFAVVFGAAQLAGRVMMYSATSAAGVIFGMAVIVAPLFITPLLVKFSGGLLGKILGVMNNPNKGLIDRSRNWANKTREQKMAKNLASGNTLLARRRRARFNRNRRDEEKLKRNQDRAENAYRRSKYGRESTLSTKSVAHQRQLIDAEDEKQWNEALTTNRTYRERELKLRVTTDQSSLQKAIMDATHAELKAGHYATPATRSHEMTQLIADATKTSEQIALTGMRKQQAEVTEKSELTQALLANRDAIREYAGGIRGAEGAETVLASAIASYRKEYNDRIGEKSQLMQHFNLSSTERQDVAMGRDVTKDKDGAIYTFKHNDEFAREAAIDSQLKTGAYKQIKEIIDQSGAYTDASGNLVKGATYEYRTTISQLIPQAGLAGKAVFWGTKTIDDISQGKYYGPASEQAAILDNIKEGKLKAEVLAGMDATALTSMYEIKSTPAYKALTAAEQRAIDDNYNSMCETATDILDNPLIAKSASEAAIKVFERFKL